MFDHMMNSNNLELKDSEGKDFEEADFIFIKEMIDREMDASKEWVCKGRPTKKFLYEVYGYFLLIFSIYLQILNFQGSHPF